MGDSDVSRRLAHSRWRRLPGVFRTGERQQSGPGIEPERLTLYLPARDLDLATELAAEAGFPSTQAYCESLLQQAIQAAAAGRHRHGHGPQNDDERSGAMEGLDAIANDPDYLAEWSQSRGPREDDDGHDRVPDAHEPPEADEPALPLADLGDVVAIPQPVEVRLDDLEEPFRLVLYHASLGGEPPPALLASLRAGIAVEPDAAQSLITALATLQDRLHGNTVLDRRLAFALHRLALETQILLTETWPGLASDPLQVEILRRIQDHVDALFAGTGPDPSSNPAPQE